MHRTRPPGSPVLVRALTRLMPALALAAIGLPEQARAQALDRPALRRTLDSLAASSGGRLGVGIELLETRERVLLDSAGQFPMQSVYKMPIAMATLAAVDAGRLRLDQPVTVSPSEFVTPGQYSPIRDRWPKGHTLPLREVLRYNTVESDGTACDVLLRLVGGPAAVQAWLDSIDVRDIRVRDPEITLGRDRTAQYRNWATPAGALTLLRAAQEGRGLSTASRALLLEMMQATTTGPRRLKAGLPAGMPLAHRTGSGGSRDGIAPATNDIGIATLKDGRHVAIAVFLRDSRANEVAREGTIAAVAATVIKEMGASP